VRNIEVSAGRNADSIQIGFQPAAFKLFCERKPLHGQANTRGPYNCAMADVNPAGTAFLGLVEALIDLQNDPDVSNIEVVMGSYEVDEQGKDKLIDGQLSVEMRPMIVRGMNKDVQEELRKQIDARPLSYLMILWTERSSKGPLGMMLFDPVTKQEKQKPGGIAGLDKVEKSAIADYLQRAVKKG
jgi:hypothetical protein